MIALSLAAIGAVIALVTWCACVVARRADDFDFADDLPPRELWLAGSDFTARED